VNGQLVSSPVELGQRMIIDPEGMDKKLDNIAFKPFNLYVCHLSHW
jgi:hypothetical protein